MAKIIKGKKYKLFFCRRCGKRYYSDYKTSKMCYECNKSSGKSKENYAH